MVQLTSGSRLTGGLVVSTVLALVAVHRRTLTPAGGAAAIATGTHLVAGAGARAGLSMITFFLTSSALSRVGRASKVSFLAMWEKSDTRDATQVFANGGVATVCAMIYGHTRSPYALRGCCAAISTAAADTWATEVGSVCGHAPRIITTGRVAEAGTSGAVSWQGVCAALAGAAITSSLFWLRRDNGVLDAVLCATSGVAGSVIDSVLGATIQARYRCQSCDKPTERKVHTCGATTTLTGGYRWCTNDVVNLLSTGAGSLIAASLGSWRYGVVGKPSRVAPQ